MVKVCRLGAAFTILLCAAAAPTVAASYKTLYAMTGTGDGAGPTGGFTDLHGTLYGVTTYGGATGNGTIVSLDPSTGTLTKLYDFTGAADGFFPQGNLISIGGLLYGLAQYGGAHGQGTLFSFNPATGKVTVLWNFTGSEGIVPGGSLIEVGGNLYGTAQYGGANGLGTVFMFAPSTATATAVYSFRGGSDALNPIAGLASSSGMLYGTSPAGGANGQGAIYAVDPSTGIESVAYSFTTGTDAAYPYAPLTAAQGKLFGTSQSGGANGAGTVFSFDPAAAKEAVLHSFSPDQDGSYPQAGLTFLHGVLYGVASEGGPLGYGTIFSLTTAGDRLDVLQAFEFSEGDYPTAPPLLLAGMLYGTAGYGGANGQGSVYTLPMQGGALSVLHSFTGSTPIEDLGLNVLGKGIFALSSNGGSAGLGALAAIAPSRATTTLLHEFTAASGFGPVGSLSASPHALYGFSDYGGTAGCGGLGCPTLFEISPTSGAQTPIYQFPADDPGYSVGDLLRIGDKFYGTTYSDGTHGFGTVFAVDAATGTRTTIYNFAGGKDGAYPFAPLVRVGGGLYGTTTHGGAYNGGTLFAIRLKNNAEEVLYAFSGSTQTGVAGNGDAAFPYSGVIDVGGTLYGTSFAGGAYGWGTVYGFNLSSQTLQILHSFQANGIDGTQPGGNLLSLNGLLYGMTVYGGSQGAGCEYNVCGTVFSIDPTSGAETILHAFTGGADGGNPSYAPLVVLDGVLYGSTGSAGAHGLGTVFSYTP